MANEVRLIDVPMGENDINANTVGEFLKTLLLQLWKEAEGFSSKRPFGNSDWQYQVYASLIKAGYEIGKLDEDGYVETVDYKKADKLIESAIAAVFERPESLRPVGRWIVIDDDYEWDAEADDEYYVVLECECSVCGERTKKDRPNYCDNCGAKMMEG